MRLVVNYCYSLYGCCLWNITNPAVEYVCIAWRAGDQRVWVLPDTTHCTLLPLITSRLPIMDEIVKRLVAFVQKCLLSDCELVSFVTRYAIWVGRMSSPLGANVYHCVTRCGQDIDSILHFIPAAIGRCFWRSIFPNDVGRANLLAELLLLQSGVLTFSSSGFSPEEVNSIVVNVACY